MAQDNQLQFEIYRLHTELAERAASVREGMNNVYSGLVAGIVAASVLLHRLDPDGEVPWILPALGVLLSLSWMLSLHSATGRLSAKHRVLISLEERLPFQFLKEENQQFDKGTSIRRKYTAYILPLAFVVVSCTWLVFILCQPPST